MSQKVKVLLFITFFYSCFSAFAQTPNNGKDLYANIPYSRIQLGEFSLIGNLKNIGMGGAGVAYGDPGFVNTINPAHLINNRVRGFDSLLTVLEASGLGQFRNVSNKSVTQVTGNLNFNYFSYALPISKRWTTNIGLRPYSNVSYSLTSKAAVKGSPTDSTFIIYDGFGGIYQADFANGFKINQNFSIGLLSSFLFGKINHESISQVFTIADPYKAGSHAKIYNTGFLFRPGVSYRKKLQPEISRDSAVYFNFGFTYEFFAGFQQNQSLLIQTRTNNNAVVSQNNLDSRKKDVGSPHIYRAGISFDKYKTWNVAADFVYSDWTAFKGYGQGDTLKSGYTVALGGELGFNLKRGLNERDAFLKRNYFRAGLSFTKTPFYIQGKAINDMSFSLGYSLPVGSSKNNYTGLPLPMLTTAIVIGQKGTYDNNLVKDKYCKIYLSLTINDKWFRRRRVD